MVSNFRSAVCDLNLIHECANTNLIRLYFTRRKISSPATEIPQKKFGKIPLFVEKGARLELSSIQKNF